MNDQNFLVSPPCSSSVNKFWNKYKKKQLLNDYKESSLKFIAVMTKMTTSSDAHKRTKISKLSGLYSTINIDFKTIRETARTPGLICNAKIIVRLLGCLVSFEWLRICLFSGREGQNFNIDRISFLTLYELYNRKRNSDNVEIGHSTFRF